MSKRTTAVRVMCVLSMTYDNALPCAPLVHTAQAVRNSGDKRPSATTARRKRVPRRCPLLPEGEGK